jgi:hypothetical protein
VELHLTLASQILPGSADPLQGHSVVEKAPHDAKGYEITKRVETANTGPAAAALNRRLDESYPVPVTKLMMRAIGQPTGLVGCE